MEAIGMVDTNLTRGHCRGSPGQYPWPTADQGGAKSESRQTRI
jgi:hypothetical protein